MNDRIIPAPGRSALLVIDMQPDFMPGGALPVTEGEAIVPAVARLMRSGAFAAIVATQDWHPPGHVSFASSHPRRRPFESIEIHGHRQTLWPDHCVQGTAGAALYPALPWERAAAIIRKGMDPLCDSKSAFRNDHDPQGQRSPTGLEGYLRGRGVDEVYLCGLARDVCVRWTALDAAAAGFCTFFVWDATRAVDPRTDAIVRAELSNAGIRLVTTADIGGT